MPSLPELKPIHAEMLDLLRMFDALCRAWDVKYSLDSGTLLGAVREKGFIPWDDDVDVALTRGEYERFRDRARVEPLPEHVTFSEYAAQHPRVWLRRPGRPGAWIDLFIYDGISANPVARRLKILGCRFFLAFTKTPESLAVSRRVGKHRGARGALMTLGYALGRPFSPKLKANLMNAFCKHAFRGNGTWMHRSNDQYSWVRMIFPASCMTRYTRLPFEDEMLMATADYDAVLRICYGPDYMTPKRAASHDNPAHKGYGEQATGNRK